MIKAADNGTTVYIVDDDASIRDALSILLGALGYRAASFASAEALLAAYQDNWTGCIVADLRLPGKSGIELLAALQSRGSPLPFVIISAHGDVAAARAAFQLEAVDFIEKPFDEAQLRAAIDKCLAREAARLQAEAAESAETAKLATLTPREHEVLDLVGKGLPAKEIARVLAISPYTVHAHKSRIMTKLGAHNVSELVRYALTAGRTS